MVRRSLVMVVGLLVAFAAHAKPEFGDLTFSTKKMDGDAQTVFKSDTPNIFLHAEIDDVDAGTKLSATWIAEKTDKAPPNTRIDSAVVVADDDTDFADFELSKPNAGWPVGDYRVDLSIDGSPAGSAHFKIAD